ncbi:MBL fold metallo-hydrolase [bacterium]|nr:MBL fold metallo-hydrolase [bacterium]
MNHYRFNDIVIIQFEAGPIANFQYLVIDTATQTAAAVDPGWEAHRFVDIAKEQNVVISQIWLTHGHPDHVNQLVNLQKLLGPSVPVILYQHPIVTPNGITQKVTEGQTQLLGKSAWTILHLPGHSPDSICFMNNDALICGDVLFIDACGRSDLPGSNPIQLSQSLARIATLPPQMQVFPGHDYGPSPTDTIAGQCRTNPHLSSLRISHPQPRGI